MHNRKILVIKNNNYAASKTSATQNTALNPADLADGAVGIYGTHRAAGVNLNKFVLITDGGSEVAGAVPMANFVGEQIQVAMGTATGAAQLSNPIDKPTGLIGAVGTKYVAPVLGVIRIGYNGTSGSLNAPGTILRGDDLSISIIERNYIVAGNRDPHLKKTFGIQATVNSESIFSLLTRWVAFVVNQPATNPTLIDKTKIKILHNGTGAVFTTSATVAAVNGATTLTTSAAHGVTAGDLISLGGDLYATTTGTTGSTLVLTRPYSGPTATIANAATLDITGAPTQWGLEFTDDAVGRNIVVAQDGIINTNATVTYAVAPSVGAGTEAQIRALEDDFRPAKGTHDMIHTYMKRDSVTRASGNYDQYILTVKNSQHPNGDQGSVFKVINYLYVAFVEGVADTTNFAQSDFEDIMTSLFTTFPAISA